MEPSDIRKPNFTFVSVNLDSDDPDSVSGTLEIKEEPDVLALNVEMCTMPDIQLFPEASASVPALSVTSQGAEPFPHSPNQDIEDHSNISRDRILKLEVEELSIDVKPTISATPNTCRNFPPHHDNDFIEEATMNIGLPFEEIYLHPDLVVKQEPDASKDYNFLEVPFLSYPEENDSNDQMKYSVKQELDLPSDEDTEYNPDESDTSSPEDSDYCDKTWRSPGPSKSRSTKKRGKSPSGFTCNICGKEYRDKLDLVRHLTTNNPDLPCKLSCPFCYTPFKKRSEFYIHLKTHKKPTNTCNVCSKTFNSLGNFKRHIGSHTEVFSFECDICKKLFKQKENLSKHVMQVHSEKKFKCPICHNVFSRSGHLKRHLTLHKLGDKQFVCDICPFKQFDKLGLFEKHMRVHNPENEMKCPKCVKLFYHRTDLNNHLNNVHGKAVLKCTHCEKMLVTSTALNRHILSHVSKEMPHNCDRCAAILTSRQSVLDHRKTHQLYPCPVCKMDFKGKHFLNQHLKKVHSTEIKKLKLVECEICNRKCSSRGNFNKHKKCCAKREVKEVPPFKCPHCEKVYAGKRPFNKHILTHVSANMPVKCEKCDEVFTCKQVFLDHRSTHFLSCLVCKALFETKLALLRHNAQGHTNSIMNIHCKPCGKEFIDTKTFKHHKKACMKRKQVQCPLCPKQFEFSGVLKLHMKLHSEGYKCSSCPQVFKSAIRLKAHMSAIHSSVKCPVCNEFIRKTSLKMHSVTHTGVDRPYKCHLCSEIITSYDAVIIHRKMHVDRSFPCPICKYYCGNKSALKHHIWRHSNPYCTNLCPHCGKGFRFSVSLEQHIKTHSLSHPFRCGPCGKSFKTKHILRFHMYTHFRQGPRKCGCGHIFVNYKDFRCHKKLHSNDSTSREVYNCDTCGKSFNARVSISNHCKSHLALKLVGIK